MNDKKDNLIFRILPRRAFFPVTALILLQFAVYYLPKLFGGSHVYRTLLTPLDTAIPFVPFFVVFYVLAYLQWIAYYLILAREERDVMIRFFTAGAISKLICLILFLVLPATITRPDTAGSGLFRFCCGIIYRFDEPTNLFPSMHCLESWLCMRLALEQHRRGRVPEVSRSMVRGYSGEMIRCVNRKKFTSIEEYLTKERRAELETFFERLVSRRKWRLDRQLEAAADDIAAVAENESEVFIVIHTLRTCILSALVLLSTLLIKQHYVADMAAAIAVAELSLFLGKLAANRNKA